MSIELTDEFEQALAIMEAAEEHAFITGRAGTGKSTLLRHFMSKTRRRVAVLAPTGLAAVNVGGQTIHSFFKLPPRVLHPGDVRPLPPRERRLFADLDTIIIDEISMVRADVLDAIDQSLRLNRGRHEVPFGGVQVIAFGDLLQLAPVVQGELQEYFAESYETPYFFSANVLKACDWRLIELTRNYRQSKDPSFFELLTRLGHNEMTEDDLEQLNARLVSEDMPVDHRRVTLTSTNAAAAAINERRLAELPGEPFAYEAVLKGEFDDGSFPTDDTLWVKKGAQVILLRNDLDRRWVNGDVGAVEDCSKTELHVRIRGEVYRLEPVEWERKRYVYSAEDNRIGQETMGTFKQFPIKLAWALTIHKSQGQTLKEVVVDLGRGAFAHGQAYVALSRCESLAGLWLRRPLRPTDVLFDDRVLSFLKRSAVR
jgi:ATP-dependent exoDNAse (exonuclease V) alpha subunit